MFILAFPTQIFIYLTINDHNYKALHNYKHSKTKQYLSLNNTTLQLKKNDIIFQTYILIAVWVELKKLTNNYKGGGNLWDFRVVSVRADTGSFLTTQGLVTGERRGP